MPNLTPSLNLLKVRNNKRRSQECEVRFELLQCEMFLWKIQVQIVECQGISYRKNAQYSLLVRMADQFSTSSASASSPSNLTTVPFDTTLGLSFRTGTLELPTNEVHWWICQLQIILSMMEGSVNGRGEAKEDIIGIASVTVCYPLQEYLKKYNVFKFDKSLDSKGSIKAKFEIQVQEKDVQVKTPRSSLRSHHSSKSLILNRQASSQSQFSMDEMGIVTSSRRDRSSIQIKSPKHRDRQKYKQTIESLTSERNQLYKISNELYTQLKKATDQRDQYLQQLREKILSQEQTKAELQFLKLKIEEHEESHHAHMIMNNTQQLNSQIDALRKENDTMGHKLQASQKRVKELERKVSQSVKALSQFRQEAIDARSELIHKESQLSIIQTKTLDPQECMQELLKEIQERQYEEPFDFSKVKYQEEYPLEELLQILKVETASLFTKLLPKMRAQKDKEWLLHQKGQFERLLQEQIMQFSFIQ